MSVNMWLRNRKGYEWKLAGKSMRLESRLESGVHVLDEVEVQEGCAAAFSGLDGTPEAIAAFAEKHGLLGVSDNASKTGEWHAGYEASYQSEVVGDLELAATIPCSLERWRLAIAQLSAAWRLAEAIEQFDRTEIKQFVLFHEDVWFGVVPKELRSAALGPYGVHEISRAKWLSKDEATYLGVRDELDAARLLLSQTLTAALTSGVDASFDFVNAPTKAPQPVLAFRARSLLHALWLQFAQEQESGVTRAVCIVCHNPFSRGSVRGASRRSDSEVCSDRCKTERTRTRGQSMVKLLRQGRSPREVALLTGGTLERAQRLARGLKKK